FDQCQRTGPGARKSSERCLARYDRQRWVEVGEELWSLEIARRSERGHSGLLLGGAALLREFGKQVHTIGLQLAQRLQCRQRFRPQQVFLRVKLRVTAPALLEHAHKFRFHGGELERTRELRAEFKRGGTVLR